MKNLKTIQDTDNIKEAYQEAKDDGYDGVKVISRAKLEKNGEVTEQDDGRKKFPVVMSTEEVNRNGRLVVSNFIVEYYKENPVLLDSHRYDSIEHIVGRVENLKTENGKLTGEMVFNDQAKGRMAEELIDNGFLKAVSIGYIPVEFTEEETDDGIITIISKAELLELSMVSVPSNRKALLKKMETMEDKDVEKVKDVLKEQGKTLSTTNENDIKEAISLLNRVLERNKTESPECRMDGESKEDCIDRKIPEIMEDQDVDEDQAYAIASDMCSEPCGESLSEAESDQESEEKEEDDQDTEEESVTPEDLIKDALNTIETERTRKLRNVAKALNETHQGNVNEKKREAWKNLRDLL